MPYFIAFLLALLFHAVTLVLGRALQLRPRLTLRRLRALTRFQYYSTAAAAELLGYAPPWTHR